MCGSERTPVGESLTQARREVRDLRQSDVEGFSTNFEGDAVAEKTPERGPKFYAQQIKDDAARQGLTPEEYGIYKGSAGSDVQPVNSAGGLLVMSIVLTVIFAGITVGIVILIMQSMGLVPVVEGDSGVTPVMWFFIVISYFAPVASWFYYIQERRAQKLRLSRGLPRNITETRP